MTKINNIKIWVLIIYLSIASIVLGFDIYIEIGKQNEELQLKQSKIESQLKEKEEIDQRYQETKEMIVQLKNEINKQNKKIEQLGEMFDKLDYLLELADKYNEIVGD